MDSFGSDSVFINLGCHTFIQGGGMKYFGYANGVKMVKNEICGNNIYIAQVVITDKNFIKMFEDGKNGGVEEDK